MKNFLFYTSAIVFSSIFVWLTMTIATLGALQRSSTNPVSFKETQTTLLEILFSPPSYNK